MKNESPRKIEIIAIGDELTSGRIRNTTSGYAARQLFEAGYDICAMNTIGDDPHQIGEALKRALRRANAIIVTGGLGSTDDDLTTDAVCSAFNLPAEKNAAVLTAIRSHVGVEHGPLPGGLEKLALLPQGAIPFDPSRQMSGYLLVFNTQPVFFLPGIPEQMRLLMEEEVLPKLPTLGSDYRLSTCQRLFRVFNLDELAVNQRIAKLSLHPNVHIGYYPVFPEVHVNLTVRDPEECETNDAFAVATAAVESTLGDAIFGYDRDSMEIVTGHLLKMKKLTLATAESCTGGLIGQMITNVPGSSTFFLGGVISYSNNLKSRLLGIDPALIKRVGAVSHEVADAMAQGIRNLSGADISLAVTGIAGPGGGSEEKPVGTVYVAMANKTGVEVKRCAFTGNRRQIRLLTAFTALDMVRRHLRG